MSRSVRPSPGIRDLRDREFTQRLLDGAAIGIPLVYLITLMIMLASGAATPAVPALWTGVVAGPFIGAFAVFSFSAGHPRPAPVQAVASPASPAHRWAA